MLALYNEILYRPILNLLVFLYDIIPGQDVGLAIIAVTIIIRFALYPSFHKSLKAQKALQELQPKLQEIKEKFKDDRQKQMEATMALYKENKVNPFSSCLPLLIQLPILITLFLVLRDQLPAESIEGLYGFIPDPGRLNPMSLGLIDLAERSVVLAGIAAGLQFFQTKMLQPKLAPGAKVDPIAGMLQKQMLYILPIVTFVFAMTLPAGLPLYWATTTLFAIIQQWFIIRQADNQQIEKNVK